MKLEVGMYCRTKKGEIDKILHIDYADERKKKYPTHPSKNHWRDNFLLERKRYRATSQNIIKASHNITDLIEVGDYVNGELIQDITGEYVRIGNVSHNKSWLSNDIKTILTKEQFENYCYRIGDE